jgi:hypothetical protein
MKMDARSMFDYRIYEVEGRFNLCPFHSGFLHVRLTRDSAPTFFCG